MNEVIKVQMAVARHSDDIEIQEEDINYENETTRRSEAEGLYESLNLQKIDNAVYGDLQTKRGKDRKKIKESGKATVTQSSRYLGQQIYKLLHSYICYFF